MERPLTTTRFDVSTSTQAAVGTYLQAKSPRLVWIAVLIPLVTAVIAAVVLFNRPVPYESRLRVLIPEELGMGSGAIGLYLANVEQRLLDEDVVDEVTAATAIRPEAYVSNIRVERVGQSSDAEFRFVGDSPEEAQAVVEIAASAALRSLAEEGLPFAKREVKLAEKTYREAARALDAFRVKHGVAFPQEQFREVAAELQRAEVDLDRAKALDDPEAVANASASVEQLEKDRHRLERLLPRYQKLDDARVVALELRSRARDRLAGKQAEIRLTSQADLRRDVATSQVSRRRIVLQGAIAAAAVALFLEFAVIVLPDLLRPARRESPWPEQ